MSICDKPNSQALTLDRRMQFNLAAPRLLLVITLREHRQHAALLPWQRSRRRNDQR